MKKSIIAALFLIAPLVWASDLKQEMNRLHSLDAELDKPHETKSIFLNPEHVSVTIYIWKKDENSQYRLSSTIERIPIDTELWMIRTDSIFSDLSGQSGGTTLCHLRESYKFFATRGKKEETIEIYETCDLLFSTENAGIIKPRTETLLFLNMLGEEAYNKTVDTTRVSARRNTNTPDTLNPNPTTEL